MAQSKRIINKIISFRKHKVMETKIEKYFIKLKNGKYRFKGNFERNKKNDITYDEAINYIENIENKPNIPISQR